MSEPAVRADLSGKTCLVTGASAGIGLATARELARLGGHVVMAVRNPDKGEKARRSVMAATGRDVEMAVVDLASQASIRAFARDFAARHPRLDVLVNNAGIWAGRRGLSPDGIELTWATNVLNYFLVTDLLLPTLKAAVRARVVNVASRLARDLDLSDVQFERRPYSGESAYAQSKQADRMLTWALARRLDGSGVTANALHPGFVATEIFGKGGGLRGFGLSAYAKLSAKSPAEGADTVVWLAASPDVEGRSGLFWVDRQEHRCRFRDEAGEEALWALCRDMTRAA
ncbi:MAG TPA: SDR family oxidoreductase [Vicinamibacteria bacterium]|nr:SDR family oxidoreductase [Vicinamibacteria bacterium]